jgi:hypothetical protein
MGNKAIVETQGEFGAAWRVSATGILDTLYYGKMVLLM